MLWDETHDLEVAMSRASRAMIHVDIAIWRDIHSHPTNLTEKIQVSNRVWKKPFCDISGGSPRWNHTLHKYFLPEHLAKRSKTPPAPAPYFAADSVSIRDSETNGSRDTETSGSGTLAGSSQQALQLTEHAECYARGSKRKRW